MSSFWSWFIIIVTVANILACLWLIRWTAKPRPGEASANETTGHVWDGNLTEWNKPMPRWWLNLFYITIVFSLIYLVLYPGLGNFDGLLGWSQYKAYEEEVEAVREQVAPLYDRYAEVPIPQLANNDEAMATGGRIFANNCAVCHGADGRGAPGFPSLADGAWIHGGDPETIVKTITSGRQGQMPSFEAALGVRGVEEVAAYVYSLNGREIAPAAELEAGKKRFQQVCAGCHGADGTGNQQIGAPNLTDDSWLYSGSLAAIKKTIVDGRKGRMPAFEESLGPDRVHVVAAYVYGLSNEGASSDE
ncbi:cytochrome-c oxidase, cbb3-type subunit III [Arhodomonas sp. AD133]|uniref:cytochrome-c oxidase, cbb3-type subunit III n=1 Tax=Arhodomonas sp. AD133 TaxID=3415009 RepID=UPI003EBC05E6